ncbi:MAG TPA: hypothetical protein VF746_11740 [Longimicrobium sp.]|jgi:hypothetical protein
MSLHRLVPLLFLAAGLPAGCATPTRIEPEAGICRSPAGEFGAAACASVVGRVVDRNGAPVPGSGLSGFLRPDGQCPCNSPGVIIDANGHFASTVHWFAGAPPEGTEVPAWLRVTATGAQYPQDRLVSDSARVMLRFVPTGTRVQSAEVEIRLPLP